VNVQEFATSEFATRLWMGTGRLLPKRAGYKLAHVVAAALSGRRQSSLYRIMYGNQAGVLGPSAQPEEIHRAVRRMLDHAGMASYDLMHCVARGDDAINRAVDLGDDLSARFEAAQAGGRGVIVCACHLSNFNLAFMSLGLHRIRIQALSAAKPKAGFRIMSDLRARGLLEETPISQPALREALTRLRRGELVGVGVDWPIDVPQAEWLPFFGQPARLPTSHIRMALASGAVLMPFACRWSDDRGYYLEMAPPLELVLTGDRAFDVRHNALRVLSVVEAWIAETPEQWLMYHSVWAER